MPLALDAMAGVNGTALEAHMPDAGFVAWQESTGNGIQIQSNKAQAMAGVLGGADGVLATAALVNDNFVYSADIKPAGTGALPGLRFRSAGTLTTGSDEFLECHLTAAGGETVVSLIVGRFVAGASTTFTVATGLNLGSLFTNGIRLGVSVQGNIVTVWTEPYGGGTRTIRGQATITPTSFNDASHRHFGLVRTSNGEIGTTWYNLLLDNLYTAVITPGRSIPHMAIVQGGPSTVLYASIIDSVLGAIPLTGLSVSITYQVGSGWLTAALEGSAAPTKLDLTYNAAGLAVGVYTATVNISGAALNSPFALPVVLEVKAPDATFGTAKVTIGPKEPSATI